ncbi:hypothetical protein AB0442_25330 [Kitasatospora sp. NPDC085895]|uniref:hypothetical protein n=1 Tax=Kitasatospora sp. NPDC085895 TaxID=3155057 RepID=UPI00344F7608
MIMESVDPPNGCADHRQAYPQAALLLLRYDTDPEGGVAGYRPVGGRITDCSSDGKET